VEHGFTITNAISQWRRAETNWATYLWSMGSIFNNPVFSAECPIHNFCTAHTSPRSKHSDAS